ncbi:hypothetical protein JCGZ_08384 [Jatropha curcas]|uniref:Mitochondrial fission 1 protein n=1 Tax=Jatropha curcas TaxID=180498 RepID=A0A067KVV3_JATCU|nr:hypothetical protein JCGZ_08384 [Jatropha curcas]
MLEGPHNTLDSTGSPLKLRKKLYLLAVGYYRSSNYTKSRRLVEECFRAEPEWRQAQYLKKAIEGQIRKDGFIGIIGIGIAATAVGLVAGGLAAPLSRR